jgi:hypothetical protein
LGSLAHKIAPQTAGGGTGSLAHVPDLIGKAYLISASRASDAAIARLLAGHFHPAIETDAGTSVHMELRSVENETLLHMINPERLWDEKAPKIRNIAVTLALPAGQNIASVQHTSPQKLAGAVVDLPFEVRGDSLSFKVPLEAYEMVIITHTASRPVP